MINVKRLVFLITLSIFTVCPIIELAAQAQSSLYNDETEFQESEIQSAIMNVMEQRRGLTESVDNPDTLIRSAEDIREAFRLSCELSGVCLDEEGNSTFEEQPYTFPAYDVQQGLENSKNIFRRKYGAEPVVILVTPRE